MISGIRHPQWSNRIRDWEKWRSVFQGGEEYIDTYLKKFSSREDIEDFNTRRSITPTPNFAKAAVTDIKNSIFQRLVEVRRTGGSPSYQKAVKGLEWGVDRQGSSMNGFIGRELLIDLLVMAKVGVFVDMPSTAGATLRDTAGIRPYLYPYRAEDILSWTLKAGQPDEFQAILLRDYVEEYHATAGLPQGCKERYRYLFLEDGRVHVRFYETLPSERVDPQGRPLFEEKQVDLYGDITNEDYILNIPVIPFVMVELSDSLMADVANHQIALLNMESSDVNYSLKSNFPFYTEQSDNREFSQHLKPSGPKDGNGTAASGASQSSTKEINVGATQGRSYGKDLDRPDFIHPSPEPLLASMEKQKNLKDDIRMLVNLALSAVRPKMASAESKELDQRGLDAGLSNIGLELEHAERKIAQYWHILEDPNKKVAATVKYPEKWSLKTDEDRREEAKHLREIRDTVPSARFQKSISKEIALIHLETKVSEDEMIKILAEIESAQSYTAVPETVFDAVDRAILDLKTAAKLLGWPESVVEQAAKDHAERLSRISEAQTKRDAANQNAAARGNPDFDGSPAQSAAQEKETSRDRTDDSDTRSRVRGKEDEEAKL